MVPYDFWPLVADSTVIVQHVCSVVVFVCCFVGIYQDRVEPVAVVGLGSAATIIGWLFWDAWSASECKANHVIGNGNAQPDASLNGHGTEKKKKRKGTSAPLPTFSPVLVP